MKKKGDDKEKEDIADSICKGMLIIMCHKINFVKEKKKTKLWILKGHGVNIIEDPKRLIICHASTIRTVGR